MAHFKLGILLADHIKFAFTLHDLAILASLDDVAEILGISLPVKEYDTLGGYIFGVLGHIPEDGTTFALETDGMQIRVERVEGHRILDTVVRYEKTELQEAADEV